MRADAIFKKMVDATGIEPVTPSLSMRRSPAKRGVAFVHGDLSRDNPRTPDAPSQRDRGLKLRGGLLFYHANNNILLFVGSGSKKAI